MTERGRDAGGCGMDFLAFLAVLWILFHIDQTLAFLDRVIR